MNPNSGTRRGARGIRLLFFIIVLLCIGLIAASRFGLLSPIESILATPLNTISGFFNRASMNLGTTAAEVASIQTLQQRVADLEQALAQYQAELVDLREIENDYYRISSLLNYVNSVRDQEFLAADVINSGQDPSTITINRGTRDGVAVGMPIITEQGLVGRVIEVQSNAAFVLLITDPSSAISARLLTTRSTGTVQGRTAGNLLMNFIPLNDTVINGELVYTSGLGGNLPPDIPIGQVTSVIVGADLYQQAQVRSLINFSTLEIVLVVTNFQPVDTSIFDAIQAGN